MTRDEIEAALAAVIEDPRNGGFWWPASKMAPIVYRRWFSFERRNRSKHPTQEDRIADLAKGIEAAFDPGGLYSPPGEMLDLARALAVVLEGQSE